MVKGRSSSGPALVVVFGLVLLLGVNASDQTVKEGQKAHPIEATDADGNRLSLKQYEGKLVLLDFWASWCPPCREEIPVIKQVYKKYHEQGFEVIGIALDEDRGDVMTFIKEQEVPWRQVLDTVSFGRKFGNKYGVALIPTAILLGPDGTVIDTKARGPRLERLVAKHINSVTNKEPIDISKAASEKVPPGKVR